MANTAPPTDFRKVLTDTPISSGGHSSPAAGACVMEKVSLLWALHEGLDVLTSFSALPECTNIALAHAAIRVNDSLGDPERQRLNALIPRLLRARRTESDRRVNVRLAVFCARYVLDLVEEQDRAACEAMIEAAEAWLDDPSVANADAAVTKAAAYIRCGTNAASAAHAAAYAANAAQYASPDAPGDLEVANRAGSATQCAANAAPDRVRFLDALLDAWEEAVTKEGEDLYVPREWEDEALAFVSEYMTQKSG